MQRVDSMSNTGSHNYRSLLSLVLTASQPGQSLDDILVNFLKLLFELGPTRCAELWLYDSNTDSFVLRSYWVQESLQEKIDSDALSRHGSFHSRILAKKFVSAHQPEVIITNELGREEKEDPIVELLNVSGYLSFPILNKDSRLLGAIDIYPNAGPDVMAKPAQQAYAETIAYFPIILQIAQLHSDRKLMDHYDEILGSIFGLEETEAAWNRIAILVRDLLDSEACSVFLIDSDGSLRLRGSTGIVGDEKYESVRYYQGEGLTGHAFLSKNPVLYHSGSSSNYQSVHRSKYREKLVTPGRAWSILIVPLINPKGDRFGVIRCVNKRMKPQNILTHFSYQDVVALQDISRIISSTYSKIQDVWAREAEREGSINALHHELIAPIDGLLGHLDWIKLLFRDTQAFPSEKKDRLEVKLKDISDTAGLIENLVLMLKPIYEESSLDLRPISIYELFQQCVGSVLRAARDKNILLTIDPLFLPRVQADRSMLMRVFYNVLRNAVKYADMSEPSRYVKVSGRKDRDNVAICVEDNGIGILEQERELIFKRFTRGSNAYIASPAGTGLGLFYCRQILSSHRGGIQVEGCYKPTRFLIRIPIENRRLP